MKKTWKIFWNMGINGNIVECKDPEAARLTRLKASINRNIVECKAINDLHSQRHHCRINRNIVECKAGILPFRCF